MIKIVDVSSHNSATGYSIAGCDGVIVKATQGTTYTNPNHAAQVKRGRDNGLGIGHYHYSEGTDLHAQVDYFLKQAKPQPHDWLALDWENPEVSSAEKDDFLAYCRSRAAGRKILLYCNTDFWLHRESGAHRADGLWVAAYNGRPGNPGIKDSWWGHQYTDTPVDLTVAQFSTRAQLLAWAGATPTPTHLPVISLAHATKAFHTDPSAKQGHQTYGSEIKILEHALVKVGCMHTSKYTEDGSAGTETVKSYSDWQKKYSRAHKLNWGGSDVNGFPGMTSLRALGAQSGLFSVVK